VPRIISYLWNKCHATIIDAKEMNLISLGYYLL
jgi:hypothetical protein